MPNLYSNRMFPAGGAGRPTREQVHARTQELARLAGRPHPHVAQADYEQAKRDLTGESDQERQQAILDSTPAYG